MRLDLYLVEKCQIKTRTQAQKLISSGVVFVNGKKIEKASYILDEASEYDVQVLEKLPYVSRGGEKLAKALMVFQCDVRGKRCLDIGASTGGFTDCLLKNGASHVTCVDVGCKQLAQELCEDTRVTSFEKMNARTLTPNDIGEKVEIIVMDVSFISATCIIPQFKDLLQEDGKAIVLIKPQFEVGEKGISKNGIVKDTKEWERAIERVIGCIENQGLGVLNLTSSPIQGSDGNHEFLVYFQNKKTTIYDRNLIRNLVAGKEN